MSAAGSPLAETAGRLTALDTYRTFRVGIPGGDDWVPVDRLADAGTLAPWYELLREELGDRRAAIAALSRNVAGSAVLIWAYPVFAEARLPLCAPDETAVRRHPDGWVDAVAFGNERVAVLPGDPAAGAPGVEILPSREALLDGLARRLADIEPLLAAVRGLGRLGWPALWGEVADQVGAGALWLARLAKRDRRAAWRDAERVFDQLAAARPQARVCPRSFAVTWSGGEELFAVRGTCCLNYRAVHEGAGEGKRLCSTCPLRSDEERVPLLRAHLEGRASV